MSWWIAGATVAGGVIGASGQKSAAKTAASSQTQAAELQAEVQREVLAAQREVYEEQVARLDPFRKAGVGGLAGLVGLSTPGGQAQYLEDYYAGPQFAAQSQAAQQQQLAASEATGGLQSTSTQNQLARISPTLGAQALQQQQQVYGNLAGIGLQGAGVQGGYGGQYGSALSQYGSGLSSAYGDIGAAQAGQAIAGGQAQAGLGQSLQTGALVYGLRSGLFK